MSETGMTINGMRNGVAHLQAMCHNNAVEAGWWNNIETGECLKEKRNKGELICLMHSELSEAMEGARKGIMDDHLTDRPMEEVEMADCIIRILDYCGAYNLDVAGAIFEKIEYNKNRADHKVANRRKEDGKKF